MLEIDLASKSTWKNSGFVLRILRERKKKRYMTVGRHAVRQTMLTMRLRAPPHGHLVATLKACRTPMHHVRLYTDSVLAAADG